ncbi:hypothetical protein AAVH_09810 [Aphelenchoides avenae]|nr:hypothetical protein AAVH_09810 [Aphelenchus avenae]
MLGMMNCPTDSSVEFYAAPQHLKNLVTNIDVHEFVEAKPRHSVTYTEGRKRTGEEWIYDV